MTMQTADCLVKLGGDAGNTVPKFGLTVSEIAVLQVIHGNDAVVDVRPRGGVERSHRDERQRLVHTYGREQDGVWRAPPVDQLFPGAASRLFETFEELGLDPDFFAASGRVSSEPLFSPNTGLADPADATMSGVASEEDDGIGDMPPPAAGDSERLFG